MASTETRKELWDRYVAWCLDRLAEDRLCTARVPAEFRVLSERDDHARH
jgi:hypothetical protein